MGWVFEAVIASEAEVHKKADRPCCIVADWNIYSSLPKKIKYRFRIYPAKEITEVPQKKNNRGKVRVRAPHCDEGISYLPPHVYRMTETPPNTFFSEQQAAEK